MKNFDSLESANAKVKSQTEATNAEQKATIKRIERATARFISKEKAMGRKNMKGEK